MTTYSTIMYFYHYYKKELMYKSILYEHKSLLDNL